MELKQKWTLIGKIFLLNMVVIPVLFSLALYFSDSIDLIWFKKNYTDFFMPLKQFKFFFIEYCLTPALKEELFYRGPIWILLSLGLGKSLFPENKNSFYLIFVWTSLVLLSAIWTVSIHPLFLPVFWAGLTWGYLVIKTKQLWPAVFSHTAANLSIYLIIKLISFIKLMTFWEIF